MKIFFAIRNPAVLSDEQKSRWMYVSNCGYNRGIIRDSHVQRKYGRPDYQLIYCKSGRITVNGEVIGDGDFRIYVPDEPQDYTYAAGDQTCYLWVHFVGTSVPEILARLGLGAGSFHFNDRTDEVEKLMLMLCDIIRARQDSGNDYAASLFLAVLSLAAAKKPARLPFSGAAALLEDVCTPVRIPDLAKRYHMSTGHFIVSFREDYGETPMGYRAKKQIEQAQLLLRDTDLPIASVAAMCGFTDPLYFSRRFKKAVGLSPTAWRQSLDRRWED